MAILLSILLIESTKFAFIDVSCVESRRHRRRFSPIVRSLCSSLRALGEKLSPTVFDTTLERDDRSRIVRDGTIFENCAIRAGEVSKGVLLGPNSGV